MRQATAVLNRTLPLTIALLSGLGGIPSLAAQSFDKGPSPPRSTRPWADPDTVPVVLLRPKGDGSPSRVFDLFHNHLLIDVQDDFCDRPPVAAYSFRDDTVFVSLVQRPSAEVCVPEYSGSRYVAAIELPYLARPFWSIRFSMPTHRGRDTVLTLRRQ